MATQVAFLLQRLHPSATVTICRRLARAIISVTVAFTLSMPTELVNERSIFRTSGRSFSSHERSIAGTKIIDRQLYALKVQMFGHMLVAILQDIAFG